MAKMLLVVNPHSGTHDKQRLADTLVARLQSLGCQAQVAWTQRPGHATEIAREAAGQDWNAVVAVGGDGTVNETAKGLLHSDMPLGIIPCGSGNGLARHLGIPMHPLQAADLLASTPTITIDSATVNGRPFFCTCGIGLDAQVSFDFAHSSGRGFYNYLRCTYETVIRYKPATYTLSIDGKEIQDQALLIAVCNASQYGNNAFIAPNASITDGLLDVTLVHGAKFLSLARAGIDVMAGTVESNSLVKSYKARTLKITRELPGAIHIDGEPLNEGRCLEIACIPQSLKVIARRSDPNVKPLLCIFKS